MSELSQKTRTARSMVRPAWDESDLGRLAERAAARGRRRTIARSVAAGSLAIAAIALLALTGGSPPRPAAEAPIVAGASESSSGVLRFRDGSMATPLDGDTELFVETMRSDAIELVLVRGAARFEVTPGLPRSFRVRAGQVMVSVVGTVFTVRRVGDGAEVSVDEGRVHVEWDPDGQVALGPGEHGVFPTARETVPERETVPPIEAPTVEPDEPSVDPVVTSHPVAPRPRVREPDAPVAPEPTPEPELRGWRALADQGRFDEGYALLLTDRDVLPSRDVESLMQAADCARLSGHPAESMAYLRRALQVGEGDPRAPMAAFTLGRVLLQQLHRPRDAAQAFAEARALSPEGSLASDALAREVEAWRGAGDTARARERALEYLRLYPQGLRAAAVRQHGGLD